MQVYAEKAIYDDPWSYCDTKYKITGQLFFWEICVESYRSNWNSLEKQYEGGALTFKGILKSIASFHTLATKIASSTKKEIVFKLRQEYRPKLTPARKAINSLVNLGLEKDGGEEKV